MTKIASLALLCLCLGVLIRASAQDPALGALGNFAAHIDVGENPKQGSVEYNPVTTEYRVTGGGANVWGATDAFQFVWARLSGDVSITADVRFLGSGAVAHRKAMLMFRQGLEPDAAYADVALHGDGLTSLQFRSVRGAETEEVQSPAKGPIRIRIERKGNRFTLYTGNPDEELKPGGTATVELKDPVYAGIGVCSHDANILETAVFSNVKVEAEQSRHTGIRSKVSIYDLKDKSVRVVHTADKLIEAPNWSHDGKFLLVNTGGNLYRLALNGKEPAELEKLDLGPIADCNNDHGFSFDGARLAFSCSSGAPNSQVFVASADGSGAKLVTSKAPSYFHGWSPDGRWLAFVGERENNFDLFRISANGGEEQRLTSHPGYDDGPDYSPDGKWIYFNSNRSGSWDIWRIPADGAGPGDSRAEQVTNDEWEDWFPHPSPDGKWLVFLSFPRGTEGHDARMEVSLRMMLLPKAKPAPASIQELAKIIGGQGAINVNSWSPDSKKFAFVTFELTGK